MPKEKTAAAPRRKTSRKRAEPKTTDVLVVAVLDRSGSMSACRDAAIEGWNSYLTDLQADEEGETYLTVLGFDDQREVWVDGKPVREAVPLSYETYVPRGMTALYDSIAHGIGLAEKTLKNLKRPDMKVLIVTVTDGYENASVEYRGEEGRLRLKELVESYEQGNFTFVYLSSDVSQPASVAAAAIGIPSGNTASTSPSHGSTITAYSALSATTSARRSSKEGQTVSAFADAGLGNDYTDAALRSEARKKKEKRS